MNFMPNSLENHWMPFTGNRDFKEAPRLVVKGEGVYYWNHEGERLIDRAFGRGLALIAIALVGGVLSALAYRAAARALFGPRL